MFYNFGCFKKYNFLLIFSEIFFLIIWLKKKYNDKNIIVYVYVKL